MDKKLTRCKKGKKMLGVCAGIAKYFDIDVTLVRIGWVIASLIFGGGIIAYFVCGLLMPEEEIE